MALESPRDVNIIFVCSKSGAGLTSGEISRQEEPRREIEALVRELLEVGRASVATVSSRIKFELAQLVLPPNSLLIDVCTGTTIHEL